MSYMCFVFQKHVYKWLWIDFTVKTPTAYKKTKKTTLPRLDGF